MTIRNKDVYVANLWDWGFMDNCFGGTRIRVTDVDGLVERRGQFLLLEAKSPGKDIPRGQRILFDALVESPAWNVLVIWGEPSVPMEAQIWGHPSFPADTNRVKGIVSKWYRRANTGGHVMFVPKDGTGEGPQ